MNYRRFTDLRRLTVVSGEDGTEPLTLATVKNELKVDFSADDDLITSLITAARQWAEKYTGLVIIPKVIKEVYQQFPAGGWRERTGSFELTAFPLRSVDSVKYYDADGNLQEIDSANYIVDTVSKPPRIGKTESYSWPTVDSRINPIEIQYQAGYADADAVPDLVKRAMLMVISDAYINRQNKVKERHTAAEWLLDPYKIYAW